MAPATKLLCSSTLAFVLLGSVRAASPDIALGATIAAPPSADALFGLAKSAWRSRTESPFVTYNLREEYTWRGRIHDNWWTASYRDRDRSLRLQRMMVPADEAARMRGFPIALNLRIHKGDAHADSLDTNPDADAFPILDPIIEPNASFGMLNADPNAALVGGTPRAVARAPVSRPTAASQPAGTSAPSMFATAEPLRELAHVEAVARDYTIAYAGVDQIDSASAYHLTLTPVRNPQANRLRDIWIDPATFATLRIGVQGLFEGKPYDAARWTVSYIALGGRYYIRDIRSDDSLRFGMDRTVTGLRYDFVSYAFPASLPDTTFSHLL